MAGRVGLVGGISIALILERAERGFRTDEELATETNLPCLGMLLETRRPLSHTETIDTTKTIDTQTAHAIILAAGIAIPPAASRLLLVTSSVPDEGKSLLIEGIAHALNNMGLRTLTIDLSPKARKPEIGSNSPALEDVIKATDLGPLTQEVRGSTVLCSAAGPGAVQTLITSPAFSKFLRKVREVYDVVLVETPAVMLFADAFYLSRFADFVLHAVRWGSTPRRTVAAALERMRNLDITINGVVLSRVDPQEYRRYTGVAERYYRHHTASTCAVLAEELVPEYCSQQSGRA
jgi:polysaccharide biosynthesis transport protein